jgi:hypothetical protein
MRIPSINLNLPLTLIALATLILTYSAYWVTNPAPKGIFEGLARCGYFALLTWTTTILHGYVEKRSFRSFLGASAAANKIYLVYPHFTLDAEAALVLRKAASTHSGCMSNSRSSFMSRIGSTFRKLWR